MAKPFITFEPGTAEKILEGLREGRSLRQVCKGAEMPSASCVRKWAEEDAEFGVQYARARDQGLLQLADDLVQIADDGTNDYKGDGSLDIDHLQRSKLRVDTRKWILSKLVPKIYGDKQVIEHQGEIKLTDRLLRARSR